VKGKKWIAKLNKEEKERTQLQPIPEGSKTLTEIDTTENSFSVEHEKTLAEDQIFAAFQNKVASGHSPGRVLHDMKREGPFETRAVYRKTIQDLVEKYLIPPKAETAMIKAGRQKLMAEALVEGDAKTFGKLAALAAKDPELNLQQKSPAISIKIGDLREVMAGQEVIEIDYAEVESAPEESK
jgi:hypothetical protein